MYYLIKDMRDRRERGAGPFEREELKGFSKKRGSGGEDK